MLQKYRKVTTKVLAILLAAICTFFADLYVLPRHQIKDRIIYRGETTVRSGSKFSGGSTVVVGHKYFTERHLNFRQKKQSSKIPK